MTHTDAVSSEVEVAVDPATAFTAFTAEMNLWWVRGPVNFWADSARVVEVRCETGVGGRILEVLDEPDSGTVFERARITVWEPGVRIGWDSSTDEVRTEVTFTPIDSGTRVTVMHVVPPGGHDAGGSAWSRVVPRWFGAWCATRDAVPHEPVDMARLSLGVHYARPAAAARWLADVFGLEPVSDLPAGPDPLPGGEHGHPWIEFRVGTARLNVFALDEERPDAPPTHVPWVYVDDLAGHLAHAQQQGATIVDGIHPYPGTMAYVAEDLEGNRWMFSQARRTMR